MNGPQRRAFDYVVSLRDYFGTYHANKEREAYVTAALYLGATVTVLLAKDVDATHRRLLCWGIVGATGLTLFLVYFQLRHRWIAARR